MLPHRPVSDTIIRLPLVPVTLGDGLFCGSGHAREIPAFSGRAGAVYPQAGLALPQDLFAHGYQRDVLPVRPHGTLNGEPAVVECRAQENALVQGPSERARTDVERIERSRNLSVTACLRQLRGSGRSHLSQEGSKIW